MEKPISHTLRNHHIRFVPPRRLDFNLETPDGRVTRIFKAAPESSFSMWNLVIATCAPATFFYDLLLPAEPLLQTGASFFFPTMALYAAYVQRMKRKVSQRNVDEAFLYENGEQMLVKTMDGVLHKLDIIHNDTHRLAENKDKSLIFVIENADREYFFNSKQAEQLDYQIIDKIIRAVCVDTRRTQN